MDFTALTQPPVPAILVAVFLVAFILYVYITKAVNAKKAPAEPEKAAPAPAAPVKAPVAAASDPGTSSGDLELIGVDEKTAAVIMAIVSNKSGIPLNRLQFKSIALMED